MMSIVIIFIMFITSVIVVRVTLTCLYKCTVVLLAGFVIENLESSPKFMSYICINQF